MERVAIDLYDEPLAIPKGIHLVSSDSHVGLRDAQSGGAHQDEQALLSLGSRHPRTVEMADEVPQSSPSRVVPEAFEEHHDIGATC